MHNVRVSRKMHFTYIRTFFTYVCLCMSNVPYWMYAKSNKQNRESTKGFSRWKVEQRHGKFEEFGLNNWSISKSLNGGRNQVSGRVSVPCWHATPVANAPWKPLIIGEGQARYQGHEIGGKSDWLGSHCWSRIRMSFNIRERDTSIAE